LLKLSDVVEAFFRGEAKAVRTFSKARRAEAAEMRGEAVSLLVEARQQMVKLWGLSWLTPNHHSGFYMAYPLTKI